MYIKYLYRTISWICIIFFSLNLLLSCVSLCIYGTNILSVFHVLNLKGIFAPSLPLLPTSEWIQKSPWLSGLSSLQAVPPLTAASPSSQTIDLPWALHFWSLWWIYMMCSCQVNLFEAQLSHSSAQKPSVVFTACRRHSKLPIFAYENFPFGSVEHFILYNLVR